MSEKSIASNVRICQVEGCENKYLAKGFCRKHYQQLKKCRYDFDSGERVYQIESNSSTYIVFKGKKVNFYYVYAYLDPSKPISKMYCGYRFDYEPFYIGKGHGERKRHCKWDGNHSKFLSNKINKIEETGKAVIIFIVKNELEEKEAFELEISLIKDIGRRDKKLGSLVNLTDGGEGTGGFMLTKEQRARRVSPMLGKHHSENTKKLLSKKLKGRIISEETRKKMSLGRTGDKHHKCWLGKKQTPEHIEKIKEGVRKKRNMPGYVSPLCGKKHTEESKKIRSEAAKKWWKQRKQLLNNKKEEESACISV